MHVYNLSSVVCYNHAETIVLWMEENHETGMLLPTKVFLRRWKMLKERNGMESKVNKFEN